MLYLQREDRGGRTGIALRPPDLQTVGADLDAVQVGQGSSSFFDRAHFTEAVVSVGADPSTQHSLLVLREAQLPQSHVHEITQLRYCDSRREVTDVSTHVP